MYTIREIWKVFLEPIWIWQPPFHYLINYKFKYDNHIRSRQQQQLSLFINMHRWMKYILLCLEMINSKTVCDNLIRIETQTLVLLNLLTYLLRPLRAKWHMMQPHSFSTQSDPLLLPPLFSTITLSYLAHSLLFFAMLFFGLSFSFCHRTCTWAHGRPISTSF